MNITGKVQRTDESCPITHLVKTCPDRIWAIIKIIENVCNQDILAMRAKAPYQ